ncbi:MAG TPA: glycosyltransferase family 39 protein [Candidatus Saccharimonadales bacterium]|nr:glycosyltransferase family 39 protein [Candidatus Saccharimonadales bacterium]
MSSDAVNQSAGHGGTRHELSLKTCLILFLPLGFVLRMALVLWARTYVGSAETMRPFGPEICRIAAHIAAGKGFHSPFAAGETGPSAWVGPVYPYFVAAIFWLLGSYSRASAITLLTLQCVMGAATGVGIYKLGAKTLGERVGFWAALIWTCSPIFFRWPASYIWDFAATALLLTVCFAVSVDVGKNGAPKSWLALGASWGLGALLNPALLSLLPFSFIHAGVANRRAKVPCLRPVLLATLLFAAILSPWLVRNYVVFGRPVFLRDNFWFEFSLGNYHFSNGMGWTAHHPDGNPAIGQQALQLGELAFIEMHKREALDFVRREPREFLELTAHRVLWFWDGTPLHYQGQEWWQPWEFWPLSVLGWLGLLFALTRRPTGWLLYAAALIVYPIPYYLTYAQAKYRYVIEPEMLLLSVYLVSVLWGEIRRQRAPRS